MLGFNIMDSADVFVLILYLLQPRAFLDILPCDWAYPNVIDELTLPDLYWINPFQDVLSAHPFPHAYVFVGRARRESVIKVQTAMSALLALEVLRGHDGS